MNTFGWQKKTDEKPLRSRDPGYILRQKHCVVREQKKILTYIKEEEEVGLVSLRRFKSVNHIIVLYRILYQVYKTIVRRNVKNANRPV